MPEVARYEIVVEYDQGGQYRSNLLMADGEVAAGGIGDSEEEAILLALSQHWLEPDQRYLPVGKDEYLLAKYAGIRPEGPSYGQH